MVFQPAATRLGCALAMASALSACAPFETADLADRPPSPRCAEAVAEGLAPGKGHATALAMAGARHQYDDARGYLLANGYRRVQVMSTKTKCTPHSLPIGLMKCTAVARLCGR
jgi:hypothetical protein